MSSRKWCLLPETALAGPKEDLVRRLPIVSPPTASTAPILAAHVSQSNPQPCDETFANVQASWSDDFMNYSGQNGQWQFHLLATAGNPVIGGGDANVEVYAIGADMGSGPVNVGSTLLCTIGHVVSATRKDLLMPRCCRTVLSHVGQSPREKSEELSAQPRGISPWKSARRHQKSDCSVKKCSGATEGIAVSSRRGTGTRLAASPVGGFP